jgi:precorrin-2 dehydrogenase/sirohydrochlorin ferrochelatase
MGRMIEVCEKYSLDELVDLDEEDMDRLLSHYQEGIVPAYHEVHQGGSLFDFDGSFGWYC